MRKRRSRKTEKTRREEISRQRWREGRGREREKEREREQTRTDVEGLVLRPVGASSSGVRPRRLFRCAAPPGPFAGPSPVPTVWDCMLIRTCFIAESSWRERGGVREGWLVTRVRPERIMASVRVTQGQTTHFTFIFITLGGGREAGGPRHLQQPG